MIYLDNASTTQVDLDVKYLIDQYLYEDYGNAGSLHGFGFKSKEAIDAARNKVALALHADDSSIIFTSCGSEANTLAIVGLANHLKNHNLNHIITTKYEHHSILNAMSKMERIGFNVTYLDVPNGRVSYDEFVNSVRSDTGLVSIMYVNNELGTKNDVEKIYNFCKRREILFHSDCVQAMGAEFIGLGITADIISISGHKIHAPKGIGCLCVDKKYKPFISNIICGGQQEFGIRPGTENVSYIAAFGAAMKSAEFNRVQATKNIDSISLAFGGKLYELCKNKNICFECNAPSPYNISKILSLRFDRIDAETLVFLLGEYGLCVSSGSACSSHMQQPSHVLKAIGLSDEQARSTIRVSFSDYNTIDEAIRAAEIIVECISILKDIKKETG